MTKKVLISVRGTQRFEEQEEETVELVSVGTLTSNGDGYLVSYEETEMTGMAGVTTTFDVQPDVVTLQRTGTVNSTMIFRVGEKHESLYDMGFGALLMGVQANRIDSRLSDTGGVFEIEYTIEIEQQVAGTNAYRITVKETET
jgi:uncharacterized beta-barrel protein YwiB (DUF1934 family)